MRSFSISKELIDLRLNIGENIKFYRKAQDITQEILAEMLGVSCQSVSRWESGTCYPDMELLPTIADIFSISVDKLLGVDDVMEKKKVDGYLARFQAAINVGRIDECIAIAREGVAEYPNNYTLLNKLMYALFVSGDDDGNIPDWKENMENHDAEIVALGERIIKFCPDQDIRLEATARLAFQHCEMGRKAMGRKLYETLPAQEYCKENQMWWGLEEHEELAFLHNKAKQNFHYLHSSMYLLANSPHLSANDRIKVIEKYFALEELICDGGFPAANWSDIRLNCVLARLYTGLGEFDPAYKHLKITAEKAIAFDNRPEHESYSCLLLGEIELKKSDWETSDTRSLTEIVRDKWLADARFDTIRNTDGFKEIISILTFE